MINKSVAWDTVISCILILLLYNVQSVMFTIVLRGLTKEEIMFLFFCVFKKKEKSSSICCVKISAFWLGCLILQHVKPCWIIQCQYLYETPDKNWTEHSVVMVRKTSFSNPFPALRHYKYFFFSQWTIDLLIYMCLSSSISKYFFIWMKSCLHL